MCTEHNPKLKPTTYWPRSRQSPASAPPAPARPQRRLVATPVLAEAGRGYRWGSWGGRVDGWRRQSPRATMHAHPCPECTTPAVPASGCFFCPSCGWGQCG